MGEEEEARERSRPRVVDKRSSRTTPSPGSTPEAGEPPNPAPSAPEPPAEHPPTPESSTQPRPQPGPGGDGPGGEVWTPEQEEEARRMAQEIAATPSIEWVVNTAVTLANVAATKLDLGAAPDARLAIDALAGLLKAVGDRMQQAERPLRQTLAQLQMAYADRAGDPAPPPKPA